MKTRLFKKIKFRSNRKGISPVVATLLLIAIAVAAAIVSYSWIMSMIKTQSSSAQTGIRLEIVKFTNATAANQNDAINFTIRNVGSVATKIETIYVTSGDTTYSQDDFPASSIAIGKTIEMTFNGTQALPPNFLWEHSEPYDVKVVTSNGFTVEGTFYAPDT